MSTIEGQERVQAADPLQIAVYGKRGIGKSTISANLSVALAKQGQSVLQIGCDPKHDSTRLLLGGKKVVTARDYLRQIPAAEQLLLPRPRRSPTATSAPSSQLLPLTTTATRRRARRCKVAPTPAR